MLNSSDMIRIGYRCICLIYFLLWGSIILVNAKPLQERPISKVFLTIKLQSVSLIELFSEIENRTPYSFVYDKQAVQKVNSLKINVRKRPLDGILRKVLKGTGLIYLQREDNIYILPQKIKPLPNKNSFKDQDKSDQRFVSTNLNSSKQVSRIIPNNLTPIKTRAVITGRVVSEVDNTPMVGVTVRIKGSQTGVLTDSEGKFELEISQENTTLIFSYFGFLTQEIQVGEQADIFVVMQENITSLDPTIVVGYGKQKKSDISSSVGFISSQDLKEVPVTTFDQGMQGRVAGVAISQNSAAPGGAVSVRVRGATSFTSNEPLYVIDGIPIYNDADLSSSVSASGGGQARNVLSTLNPSDIESISILKDASATAIYGSRGANGVVLITTKRGQSGEVKVNFDSFLGFNQVWNQWDLLNAREFASLSNDARRNERLPIYLGGDPYYQDIGFVDLNTVENTYGEGTNWQDELLRSALTQSYQLSILGGSAKTNYAVMGGYYRQEGVVSNSDFERISLRTNVNSRVTKFLNIGTNLAVSQTNSDVIPTDGVTGATSAVIQPTLTFLPTIPLRNSQGLFNRTPPAFFSNLVNPLISVNLNENITRGFRIIGNAFAELQILEGLQFRTSLGTDIVFDETELLNVAYVQGLGIDPSNSSRWYNGRKDKMWVWENTLSYDLDIADHKVSALLGYSAQEFKRDIQFISVRNFAAIEQSTISNGSEIGNVDGRYEEYALLSSFFRLNYKFQDKYILTATVRRDGSSRFGKDNRFGIFPSVSVAWNIGAESFLKDIEAISDLKIRASYGLSGNQEIGNYNSTPNMSIVDFAYSFNEERVLGTWPTSIPNNVLGWEQTAQLDIGLDLSLFNDRIQFTTDFYQKKTSDVLVLQGLPILAGFPEPVWNNLGKINNYGVEFAIRSYNLSGLFSWNTDFNFSYNVNQIVDYPDLNPGETLLVQNTANGRIGQTIIREGISLGNFYGYQTDGIFDNQEEVNAYQLNGALIQPRAKPGDIRFADLNGDGKIDESDQTIIGNAFPDFIMGLNNRFSYGDFDLSIFFYAQLGNQVFNGTRRDLETMNGGVNQASTVLNRWRSPEEVGNGQMPRATISDPNNNSRIYSDRWIESGSFIRCRNITFSYTLPRAVNTKLKTENVRVYCTLQNAFTITDYQGFDPEVSSNGQDAFFSGYDLGAYPQSRGYILGIQLGF